MPGYTHLQRAIPVTLGHHLLAWVEMLERDRDRFRFARAQAEPSPLGSGALAGSTLPLPRPTHALRNSIAAWMQRRFSVEVPLGQMSPHLRAAVLAIEDQRFYDHLAGDLPFLKSPAYGASKAGVVNMTKYFSTLWGPSGVRVNTLSPGGVLGGQDEQFKAKYGSRVPLIR